MKQFLATLGMDDGHGSTSSGRVIRMAATLAWLASKFYNAWLLKQPIAWDTSDLEMLGTIGALGLAQNHIENKADKPAAIQTINPS